MPTKMSAPKKARSAAQVDPALESTAAPVSRDERHNSIDPHTGALTAEAIERRRELMPDVSPGDAQWALLYAQQEGLA